jgi:signal transduction histidine kinase
MDHRVESARDVDLDDTIRPLVIAQHTLERSVHWSPTGLFARGRPDHISEVLNILLDNAGRHAPGAPVWVTGREVADTVEIRVRDAGPGIPREMAERVFENGHHGPQSSGQGIGLHMASRLMQEMGGTLRLIPVTTGTVFVVSLPIARQRHDAATASAQ